jgi:hypothetical protein
MVVQYVTCVGVRTWVCHKHSLDKHSYNYISMSELYDYQVDPVIMLHRVWKHTCTFFISCITHMYFSKQKISSIVFLFVEWHIRDKFLFMYHTVNNVFFCSPAVGSKFLASSWFLVWSSTFSHMPHTPSSALSNMPHLPQFTVYISHTSNHIRTCQTSSSHWYQSITPLPSFWPPEITHQRHYGSTGKTRNGKGEEQ